MIVDKSLSEPIDMKTRLHQIVAENKISSLSMISEMAGTDEEQTRFAIEKLVDEGTLSGSFTSDGQRFFLSEVKVSTAPAASIQDEGYTIEKVETRVPKMIIISGIVLLVGGYIFRGLITINELMEPIGSAIFMVGLAVLIGGWLMMTRADPPSNIK